jgi:hypothetical protein
MSANSKSIAAPVAWALLILGCAYRCLPAFDLPAIPNCAMIGALALFGGARLRSWQAMILPLAMMALSDYVLWVKKGWPGYSPWVYASFVIYMILGRSLKQTEKVWRIGAISVSGSLLFFLITNFGVWYGSSVDPAEIGGMAMVQNLDPKGRYATILVYARNWKGLIACYTMAIPFFWATLAGDLLFSGALFGVHSIITRTGGRPAKVTS